MHGCLSEEQGVLAGTEEDWSSRLNLESSGPLPMQLGPSLCNCSSKQISGWESGLKGYSGFLGVEHSLGDADNAPSMYLGTVSTAPGGSLLRVGYITKEHRWGGEEWPKGPVTVWWLVNRPAIELKSCPPPWGTQDRMGPSATVGRMRPCASLDTSLGDRDLHCECDRLSASADTRNQVTELFCLFPETAVGRFWKPGLEGRQPAAQCPHPHQLCNPELTVPMLWFSKEKLRSDLSGWGQRSGSRGPVYYAQGLLLESEGRGLGNSRSLSAT